MNNLHASLVLALVVSSAGSSLSAQIKTFVAGQKAVAAEVNKNFQVVKGLADSAKSAADAAQTAANAAQAAANSAQTLADSLKNRTDLTGANIVDNSLEARDIKPNIVSSIDGITNDGGNIDIAAGTGVTISSSNSTKRITISATPFNSRTVTGRLTMRGTNLPNMLDVATSTTSAGAFRDNAAKFAVGSFTQNFYGRAIEGYGQSNGGTFISGLWGHARNRSTARAAYGVYAERGTTGASHYALYALGKLTVAGSKNFLHPHPKNPDKVVEFTCLEGNESGTYFRGTARLVQGAVEIAIPEAWQLVTSKDKITVHLTPIRSLARLAVWVKTRDKITVRGDEDCEFDYVVHGVRRGFENHRTIKPNAGELRPLILGIPYGQGFDRAFRNLLVENGTLNSDYTPNMQTARNRGWELREPTVEEITSAQEGEVVWQQQQAILEASTPKAPKGVK